MSEENELEYLLVKHVGDIEGAILHLKMMDKRLFKEASEVILECIDRSVWHIHLEPDDEELWFADRTWREPDAAPGRAHASIHLGERLGENDDTDETWVAEFTSAGGSGASVALILHQEYLTNPQWRKLIKQHSSYVDRLEQLGFQYDESAGTFFVPVHLLSEKLAIAFKEDDFSEAFEPLSQALEQVKLALPTLIELLQIAKR